MMMKIIDIQTVTREATVTEGATVQIDVKLASFIFHKLRQQARAKTLEEAQLINHDMQEVVMPALEAILIPEPTLEEALNQAPIPKTKTKITGPWPTKE